MLGYPGRPGPQGGQLLGHPPRSRATGTAGRPCSIRASMVEIFETQLRRSNGTPVLGQGFLPGRPRTPGAASCSTTGSSRTSPAKKQMEDEHSWDVRLQSSVGDVSERLLSPTPIEEMSAVVLEHARRLTSSATAFVGHVDERTGRLCRPRP
ncbi:MAG: hypothetical protein M0C28_00805 [Candidatus Moduliflexus flocculans]|nr:hypothetical protein [Candidatus Moduliflexus flocculans]